MISSLTPKRRKAAYLLSTLFERPLPPPAGEPIDVVIPVVPKDLGILPLCLDGVSHCLNHPVGDIYVVAPRETEVVDFCRRRRLSFVDELTVLGYGPRDIDYRPCGTDRSGWIFQQLVKLSGGVGGREHFLVIDADHILLRPHTFLTRRGRTVFYGSRECHQPYYDTAAHLVGSVRMEWLSYVDHKMLFSRTQLDTLKERLEARSRQSWDRAILDSLPKDEKSGFSEYELYGLTFPTRKKVVRPWRNKTLHYEDLADYDTLRRRWGRRYRAVTFPEWINR